jgi:alkanesulfonate monooxygenase SsuD/methylene tetrahydromethanopterin reductase-like flavin-dependent oxidoreductase (luciferase family)
MKVSIGIGGAASGQRRDFDQLVEYVVEAEKLGVDTVWTAEAWGQDAIAPLAYLQGRAFRAPLTRLKETVEIIKLTFAGERIEYHGKYHELPLPGGQGKALRLSQPGNSNIPIYLATLRPQALEYTGAVADGWLGTSFTTEHAAAHLDYLRRGAEQAGRSLADIEIEVGGTVAFGDDLDALVEPLKPAMAFTLGAMGSATTNFYNDAFKRGGWEAVGREVQRLWSPESVPKLLRRCRQSWSSRRICWAATRWCANESEPIRVWA